jgi:peptide/nickel transport system permease protein
MPESTSAAPLSSPLGSSAQGAAVLSIAPRNAALVRLRMLVSDRGALTGLIIIGLIVLIALLAPLLANDPTEQSIINALKPPSAEYWFGTDEFGRDIFSRVIYGARPALVVGLLSVLVSVAIGVPLGMVAGLRGGWIDTGISGAVDIMLSFPPLLLALMVVTLVGSGIEVLTLAIGIAHVPIFVRLARSSTMLIRELDYVAASRSFGGRDLHILLRHVLPNILGPIIVMATLSIAGAIREEAALSFLGLGVQPPNPSWGNLIRDGVTTILEAPWLALIPGLCLTVTVLAFNILGDSVRDLLDPRDLASSALKKGS